MKKFFKRAALKLRVFVIMALRIAFGPYASFYLRTFAPGVVPSLADLSRYNVNRPDQVEAIRQSLWDTQTYVDNVTTQLLFFQVPKGQGGKTLSDTNMEAAGSLPAPKSFLIQTIELFIFPTNAVSSDSTTIAANENLKDLYALAQVGWLELFIGSKAYLQEGPIMKFPPRAGIGGLQNNDDTTANTAVRVDYVTLGGPIYEVDPWVLLVPTQNFTVSLNWATAVNLNANVQIVCSLGGILYRNSQ